ncbi:SCNM1 protein, partial [Dicrurus megarhynchus]|nr:SCNM1 protein [Dicrurus megarhynchus]
EGDPSGDPAAPQKRRVAELLASAIPEDEALLLRDGRLACSVCPHRPVCDTLEMLVLHRAGRKHLDSLQRSYGRHRSPQVTPQGPQEAPGMQAPLLAWTRRIAQSALLKSAPYSSCCRRAGTKGSSSQAGISRMIPNNSQAAPEPPRHPGNPKGSSPAHREGETPSPPLSRGFSREFPIPGIPTSPLFPPPGVPKAGRKGNSRFSEGPSPERLRILRHHLHLRSRGWLQDPAGNWVKDGNAEFDSDEEEPPPLPP